MFKEGSDILVYSTARILSLFVLHLAITFCVVSPQLIPIHMFTVVGMVFGAWYTYRLASLKDTNWNKYGDRPYMTKPMKITLFQPFADYKKNPEFPPQMPRLD